MQFITYLFEKMGNFGREKEESFLKYQLEYIIKGEASDYENLKLVTEKLLQWRFAVNADYILGDGRLYGEALELADSLLAVQLEESFREPVAESILYACAYLETLSELNCLLEGGCTESGKSNFHTGTMQVLSGEITDIGQGQGDMDYEKYLAAMLWLLPEEVRNLRAMDIMEMDIRYLSGNAFFAMDWCIESYTAQIEAESGFGDSYTLKRTYGYY